MRPDRLTTKSQEALREGVDLASRKGNPELVPEHMLIAMLGQEGGVAGPLLQKAGADLSALEAQFHKRVDGLPRVSGGAEPGLSRRASEMLRKAEDEAKALKELDGWLAEYRRFWSGSFDRMDKYIAELKRKRETKG